MYQFFLMANRFAEVGIWTTVKNGIGAFIELLFDLTNMINFPSYALAIFLLTIIIKVVLYPLTRKSTRSSQAMQRLQPMMKELEAKYKSNPQKYQAEVAKLYKEYDVKPLSGCLPLLIQMPILIALYQSMYSFVPSYPEYYTFFWVKDLGSPDPTIIFPILVAIAMFAQQFLSVANKKDPMQRSMMIVMPIMFGFFARNFPAGLCVYWISYNIVGSIQQVFINRAAKKDKEEFEAKLEEDRKEKEAKKQKQKEAKAKKVRAAKEPSRNIQADEADLEDDGEYEIDYESIRPYDRTPKKRKKRPIEDTSLDEEGTELEAPPDDPEEEVSDYDSLVENYSDGFGEDISGDVWEDEEHKE